MHQGLWRNSKRRTSIRVSAVAQTARTTRSNCGLTSRRVARAIQQQYIWGARVTVLHSLAYRAPAGIGRRQFLGVAATVAALLPAGRVWAEVSGTAVIPSEIAA